MASLAKIVAVTPDLAPVEIVLEGIIIDGRLGMRIVMTGETRLLVIFTIEIFTVAGLAGAFSLLKHEAAVEPLGGGIRLPVRRVREKDVAAAESVAGGFAAGGSDPALKIGSVAVLAVSEALVGHIVPVEDERARTGRGLPWFTMTPKGGIPGRLVRAYRTIVTAPETPGEGVPVVHVMAVGTGPGPAVDHGVQPEVHHPNPVELGRGGIRPGRRMGPSRGAIVAVVEAVAGRIRLAYGMTGDAAKGTAILLHEEAVEIRRELVVPSRNVRGLGVGEDIPPPTASRGKKGQEKQSREDDELRSLAFHEPGFPFATDSGDTSDSPDSGCHGRRHIAPGPSGLGGCARSVPS